MKNTTAIKIPHVIANLIFLPGVTIFIFVLLYEQENSLSRNIRENYSVDSKLIGTDSSLRPISPGGGGKGAARFIISRAARLKTE